jgi:hypothetical protein
MIIAVPSKGRAGNVRTLKLLPNATLFVPALEADSYRVGGAANVVAVPDTVRGITRTRNWILDNVDDRHVVMIDDDLKIAGYMKLYEHNAKQKKLTGDQWMAEFAKLFEITEQLRYRIWGVSTDGALRSVYTYRPFLWRSYVTASCMGIINDGRTRFDESFPVKEDYELNLRCIKEDGGIVAARYLYWTNHHWSTDGGCKDYRTVRMERECIARLKRMYPGMITVTKRANAEFCIAVTA